MVNQQQFQEAKRRVRRIAGFYQHLIVYVLVNIGLALINLTSEPDEIWFLYPLLGWGIGVAAHGLKVFLAEGWARSWEEKKIRELMEKESRSNS
jgi:hypothetical protein